MYSQSVSLGQIVYNGKQLLSVQRVCQHYTTSDSCSIPTPQTRVWPMLGVSSAMHNSCFAWIHFRQVRARWSSEILSGYCAGPACLVFACGAQQPLCLIHFRLL